MKENDWVSLKNHRGKYAIQTIDKKAKTAWIALIGSEFQQGAYPLDDLTRINSWYNSPRTIKELEKRQLEKALELSVNDLSMDDCPYSYDRFDGFIDQFTGQNMCEHCVESVTSDENLIKDCYLKYYMEQAK